MIISFVPDVNEIWSRVPFAIISNKRENEAFFGKL
jgi:hypothetical protein